MERMTRQRRAIEAAFAQAARPLSPAEVLTIAVRAVPALGLSTVYRTLRAMEDVGVIVAVQLPGEPPRYERAEVAGAHHHHFHCQGCDRVFDVTGCPGGLQRMLPRGFVLEDHSIVLEGRCADCRHAV